MLHLPERLILVVTSEQQRYNKYVLKGTRRNTSFKKNLDTAVAFRCEIINLKRISTTTGIHRLIPQQQKLQLLLIHMGNEQKALA